MNKFNNPELQDRFKHDTCFKQNVIRSEEEYQRLLKKAEGKKLNVPQEIIQRFMKEGDEAIYFFYGYLQPHPGSNTTQLTLAFLKNFQPEPKEKFIFIYFNNQTPSSDYYFQFKKILALIPLTILENLQQFILVKPYFYIKAFDYIGLGSLNRLFKHRYKTIDSCPELLQYMKIPVKDFVTFVPQEISSQFPKTFKKRQSLVNYRINLQGQNMSQEQRKEKTQFELTIKALITKEVYKLQNYQVGDIGIPIILQLLIHYFRTKPSGLDEEGIFRKSVSIDEENQTLNQLSRRNYQYLQQIKNPHLIASLIKRFFSNLKQPVILFKTYEQLIHDQGVKDKKQHIKKHIKELPKLNFMSLAFLIQFLKKDVLPHQNFSKMSANNLAICFSPSIMRSQKPSMADLVNASKSVAITNILLSNFQQIFGTEENISKMYKSNLRRANQNFTSNIKRELEIQTSTAQYSVAISEPKPIVKKNQTASIIIDSEPVELEPEEPEPVPMPMHMPKAIQKQTSEGQKLGVRDIGPKPSSMENIPMLSGQKKSDISIQAINKSQKSSKSFEVLGSKSQHKSRQAQIRKSAHSRSSQNLLEIQMKKSGAKSQGERSVGQQGNRKIMNPVQRSTIKFSYSSKKQIKESP